MLGIRASTPVIQRVIQNLSDDIRSIWNHNADHERVKEALAENAPNLDKVNAKHRDSVNYEVSDIVLMYRDSTMHYNKLRYEFMGPYEVVSITPEGRYELRRLVGELGKERTATRSQIVAILSKRLRILEWLPKYTRVDFISDFIAGITVGLTMMPQSIAYAALADLPAQYGLYTAFVGSFVYIFFGSIKQVSIGPSSLMTLLSYSYTVGLPMDYMVLLCFLSGCVELMMGVLKLGFLVDFISAPVTSGFTSATSMIIILAQIKGLLGISFKSSGMFDLLKQLVVNVKNLKVGDTVLGISCIIFLLIFRSFSKMKIKNPTLKKAVWFLSISRNALVVLLSSLIAFGFHQYTGSVPFKIAGSIKGGFPTFQLPNFSTQIGNETISFLGMVDTLGSSIVVVPIVAILANVAIAKSFADGTVVDATQEMMTLGFCNILGSFVQAMPTTGAFTRSAVNNASGVRTPLNGLYAGSIIMLAFLLTPYFYFIPRATLSAVLISAVVFMLDYQILPILWKCNKYDFFITISTFLGSLIVGVEMGLLFGVTVSVLPLLKHWTRPQILSEVRSDEDKNKYIYVRVEVGLFFPAVEFFSQEIIKMSANTTLPIVIDFTHVINVDYTSCEGLNNLVKLFEMKPNQLVYLNINKSIINKMRTLSASDNMVFCESMLQVSDALFNRKKSLEYDTGSPLIEEGAEYIPVRRMSYYDNI